MALSEASLTCADCGANLTPLHGRIVVTMETGGEFPSGHGRTVKIPRGEVKLCASCTKKGVRGEKLGLFEEQKPIAPRQ